MLGRNKANGSQKKNKNCFFSIVVPASHPFSPLPLHKKDSLPYSYLDFSSEKNYPLRLAACKLRPYSSFIKNDIFQKYIFSLLRKRMEQS